MNFRLHSLPLRLENTVLRRLRPADLATFHAYRSDAELARYQGWSPMSRQQALAFIEDLAAVDALTLGGWIQLAIAAHEGNSLLGDVGLYLDEAAHEAEIGFTLHRDAQGMGHATRAVRAAVALLMRSTAVGVVRAVTDARNTASIGVLDRAGFRKRREQQALFKGEACTEFVYELPRRDAVPLGPQDTP